MTCSWCEWGLPWSGCVDAGAAAGGWHDSKVALLSAAVFAPAAVAMMINANLSKQAQERHWHGCLPVFAAGICLEYVTLALYGAFMP